MDPGSAIVGVAFMGAIVGVTGLISRTVLAVHRQKNESIAPEVMAEVAGLRDQVDELRHQLIETQERLDFTERLLTKGRNEPREVG